MQLLTSGKAKPDKDVPTLIGLEWKFNLKHRGLPNSDIPYFGINSVNKPWKSCLLWAKKPQV